MAGRMWVARARLEAARSVLESIFWFARLRCAAIEAWIVRTSIALQLRIAVDLISVRFVGGFVGRVDELLSQKCTWW